MQSLDIFTNNDCLNSSFLLQKKAHCGATRAFQNHFTQNLKFIYADTSAASAEFLMSVILCFDAVDLRYFEKKFHFKSYQMTDKLAGQTVRRADK